MAKATVSNRPGHATNSPETLDKGNFIFISSCKTNNVMYNPTEMFANSGKVPYLMGQRRQV
jgi:hypothetical protein